MFTFMSSVCFESACIPINQQIDESPLSSDQSAHKINKNLKMFATSHDELADTS